MGTPNISRYSYNETKDYQKVIQQQGQPVTDYDYNELQDILRGIIRNVILTIVGNSGFDDNGFKIVGTGAVNDFTIKAGKGLIDGSVCSQRSDKLASEVGIIPTTPGTNRIDYVYIDVWFVNIDSTEDPSIKHPNLTVEPTQRLKLMFSIKLVQGISIPAPASEHIHATLAQINRTASKSVIDAIDIVDLRTKINFANLNTAISNHLSNLTNPHQTTAVQVGALPNTGGQVTGGITFTKQGALHSFRLEYNQDDDSLDIIYV